MQYPLLTQERVDVVRAVLETKYHQARNVYGEYSVTASSVRYRMQEADFLHSAVALNKPQEPFVYEASTQTERTINQFAAANRQLYGESQLDLVGELWHDVVFAYADNDDTRVEHLWDELSDGFRFVSNTGVVVDVPGLEIPIALHGPESLDQATVLMLRKEWQLFAAPLAEARALVADMILAESEDGDGPRIPQDIYFTSKRLYQAFCLGAVGIGEINQLDAYGVAIDESGTSASWQSAQLQVVIGANRSKHSSKYGFILPLLTHESTHAIKTLQGALSDDEPALATGVFTQAVDGNWTSYLDYEEGNNMIGEKLLAGETELGVARKAVYQLMCDLIQRQGYNDRQVFETYWRVVAIEILSKSPDTDLAEATSLAKHFVAEKLERILRGVPTLDPPHTDGARLIYTKDLAYMNGQQRAVRFWNQQGSRALTAQDPQAYLHEVFQAQNKGHIDPSDGVQAKLIGLK
jgi:hypothetical protein